MANARSAFNNVWKDGCDTEPEEETKLLILIQFRFFFSHDEEKKKLRTEFSLAIGDASAFLLPDRCHQSSALAERAENDRVLLCPVVEVQRPKHLGDCGIFIEACAVRCLL